MACCLALLHRLWRDPLAVAATEFAVVSPVLLVLGMAGFDAANFVLTHMRVSQMALQVADNASRVGEQDVLVSRKVYENDITDVMIGADRYARGLDVATRGRIILSSLERNARGGQWIHWQRCYGGLPHPSSYGVEGAGANSTTLAGMGRAGHEITASAGDAVMFVEVAYRYRAITPLSPLDGRIIRYTGSYNVRDSRDLTGIYQTTPASPVSSCN